MNANELRDMVREVLHDELVRRRAEPAAAHEQQIETVALGSDRDLMSFVHRIVTLAGDSRKRRALESGQLVFKLAHGAPAAAAKSPARRTQAPVFDAGLVTERHIEMLDDDVARIDVARAVRLTPLALDRLRQRGIKIKRMQS